ncbi:hypothetical protein ACFOQM_24265 [Paenibacillus sp. GCM10012307]|uniref:Uncharacterized protein n=1 Tax=Paenibacillus roseus TaxID=2798579 RepID=A0A934J9I3_9BACL|nr:hypothetical protein [Paenibacillus roseus]MBJ6364339.1 hypothetical protein [Paenibacillus roseus]
MLVKLIIALICSVLISIGLSIITPGYFISYFIVAGLICIILGVPTSFLIDYAVSKVHLSKVSSSILSLFVYSASGSILGAVVLSIFNKTQFIIWYKVFFLGAIAGLLFYLIQLVYNFFTNK